MLTAQRESDIGREHRRQWRAENKLSRVHVMAAKTRRRRCSATSSQHDQQTTLLPLVCAGA